jgi:hypothetical protein
MQNQFLITDINYKSDQINTDLFCFAEYKKSVFVHPIRVIRVPLYLCPNGSSARRGVGVRRIRLVKDLITLVGQQY